MPQYPSPSTRPPGLRLGAGIAVGSLVCGAVAAVATPAVAADVEQPVLSSRSVPVITVEGMQFRDLDRDGALTPYEDWRLTPVERAEDLVGRMTLEQKAGLLVHGTLPTTGSTYAVAGTTDLVAGKHVTTFITRLSADPTTLATANNLVQEIAEQQPLGVPAVISTDPRNGFSVTAGQTVARVGTTAMPDEIGMAATGDPALVQRLGDIIRQEYRAVGITEGLSPQADIATEPRWTRINGTFGSDPERAKAMVQAYVTGLQNGTTGLNSGSVATVTKHWAGYGAQENGYDSHYYYGRYATFPGGNFDAHLIPYEGAFAANTSGIMPTYSILKDLVHEGTAVEQTGAGFSTYLLQDLLRGEYGFDGVIVSDWGITGDCPQACQENRPPSFFVGPWGAGMPWGVEDSTVLERFALSLTAGVNQIGGSNEPGYVVQAVQEGLLAPSAVDDSARRVLQQKFELGLFENPFVDAAAAPSVAGSEAFKAVGDAAQAASLTLLTNTGALLPADPADLPAVWLSGVAPEAAEAVGYTVVADVADADLAVVRMTDPRGGADLTDLGWTGQEPDAVALQAAVDAGVPTVAVPKLDRPLVLTDVVDRAAAVVGAYGVSDEVLMETVAGERRPGGRLPFELPSSMEAVRAQLSDVPDDSADPLFPAGAGLDYAAPTVADLRAELADLRAADEVRGPVAHLLDVHAGAAERSLDRGRTEQAVRELERFVGRLDQLPGGSRVSPEADRVLRQDAGAVIAALS